jgi:ornithine cyclodeaminase/alanine dehydrogenase-like protein (mu-crystallin family)
MTAASVRSACSECCLCYTIYYTQRYTWLHATAQARTMHTTTIIATTAAVYCILTATAMYCLHTYYRYASTPWHAPSAVCKRHATTRHATRHGKRNATSGYVSLNFGAKIIKQEKENKKSGNQNRSGSIWLVDVVVHAE